MAFTLFTSDVFVLCRKSCNFQVITQQVVRILWLLGSYTFETFNYTDIGRYSHPIYNATGSGTLNCMITQHPYPWIHMELHTVGQFQNRSKIQNAYQISESL